MNTMSDDKKRKIIEAARQSFAKFGYKKTTLEDIGNAIGLNKASIYYYFTNKEEIYTSVIMIELEQFVTNLQERIRNTETCENQITIYFIEKISFWSEHSSVIGQISEINPDQLTSVMDFGVALYKKIESDEKEFLIEILQQCIERGSLISIDVKRTSELLFAIADGIKDRHLGFNKLKVLSPDERKQMLEDIEYGLKTFLAGLEVH